MADAFDPYEKWLGIPKNKRPLTSYRLLGVEVFESDMDRIGRRAERRIELVEKQRDSKHGAIAKKVLQQLVEARECLLDPVKKEKYDRMLRQKLGKDAPPPPPPSPVSVDVSDDSTDDMSMFNFAGKASSNGAGGGFTPSTGGYSTSDYEPESKGGLKSNFWVIPVAIGGAGLVLLIGAILMVGGEKTPLPPIAKKDDSKEKKKDPPKNVLEAIPDPTKKPEPKKEPESGLPVTKEGLVGKWTSEKITGAADLKEITYLFKENGTFVETRTVAADNTQKDVLGNYKLAAGTLTLIPTSGKEEKAAVVLKEKKLVIDNRDAKTHFTLAKAEAPTPTTPTKTTPEKNPDPEPVAETEPDALPVWGGAVDPADPGSVAGPLALAKVEVLKPGFPVGSFAYDPSQKAAALGALKGGKIEVWNLDDGKLKCTAEVQQDDIVALAMPNPQKLIAWTAKSGMIAFNATTGTIEKAIPIPATAESGARYQAGLVVSPGGKYLSVARKGIRLYRTSDYKLAGIVPTPKDEQVISQGFRPDGTELVVVYQRRTAPFVITVALIGLADGKVDDELTKKRSGDLRDNVGPLDFRTGDMNRQYLFVGNQGIMDGEGGRMVWRVRNAPLVLLPLDTGGQFFAIDSKGAIKTPKIAWEKLDEALKQFSLNSGGVQISPDDPIALDIRVGNTVNSDSVVKQRLEQIMTARLKTDGFSINPTATTKLVIDYSEKAAGKRSELDYIDKNGEMRTKKVDPFNAIVATVKVSWTGYQWSIGFSEQDATNTEDQLSGPADKTFALGVLETVAGAVSSIDIPYFVAESALEGSVTLPHIVPSLDAAPTKR